jgi:hypothetical protein
MTGEPCGLAAAAASPSDQVSDVCQHLAQTLGGLDRLRGLLPRRADAGQVDRS